MLSEGNAPKNGEWRVGFPLVMFYAPVGCSQEFLSKQQHDDTGVSPKLPQPGSRWFNLFPPLKSAWKGRHFCNDTGIIKNATKQLKRYSQSSFQKCFQHLYSRWQKCTYAKGDYFERNVAYVIVLLCTSQKQCDSRNVLKLPRCLLFLYTQKCLSVHIHQAESATQQ
jgi:hypothetical protein